jgi:hypothetical protein
MIKETFILFRKKGKEEGRFTFSPSIMKKKVKKKTVIRIDSFTI